MFRNFKTPYKMKYTLRLIFLKYLYMLFLFLIVIIMCIYSIICIPFYLHKKTAVLCLTFVSFSLWSAFHLMLKLTFEITLIDLSSQRKQNSIVIANHLGAIDFMLINIISNNHQMFSHSKYMIKNSIMYIPILGFVKFLGFIMMHRNFEKDKNEISKNLKFFNDNKLPYWLIIYPEGTRFTEKKKKISDDFCQRRGYKLMNNVLFPRTKGFELVCKESVKNIESVLDVTCYFEGGEVPSLSNFLFKIPSGKFKIKVEEFKLDEITNYKKFLIDRFYQKDKLLNEWKQCTMKIK